MVNESVRWQATALLREGGDQMVTQFHERLMTNFSPEEELPKAAFFWVICCEMQK